MFLQANLMEASAVHFAILSFAMGLFPLAFWGGSIFVISFVGSTLLQAVAEPRPSPWLIPWEVSFLVGSARARVNHLWLHLTRCALAESKFNIEKVQGLAVTKGILIGPVRDREELLDTARWAWQELLHFSSHSNFAPGCRALRVIVGTGLSFCILAVVGLLHQLNLPSAGLGLVVANAAGHLSAHQLEKGLVSSGWFLRSVDGLGARIVMSDEPAIGAWIAMSSPVLIQRESAEQSEQ